MKTQDPPADGFVLPESGTSDAIRAAQEKLLEIRRSLGVEPRGRMTNDELSITNSEGRSPSPLPPFSPALLRASHNSENLARHLRSAAARRQRQAAAEDRGWLAEITNDELRITNAENSPALKTKDERRKTKQERTPDSYLVSRISYPVKVYPDLALGMLRTKTAAAGRVWLLLRHFDAAGRGRVAIDDAARLLAGDGAAARICGRRQLGNLLRAGNGLFWERDTGRDGAEWLRLHSATRVAAALGVRRLGGSPVAVPLSALIGTIGQARAHLYASFHSGRTRADLLTGEKQARGPISRDTLCKLSGAAANSQRNYERRARVGRQATIAIGPQVAAADEQETAWRRGRAMFRFRDDKGRHGRPGAVYLAWQLPNEYTGPHDTLPRGRLKRLNRALADLFHDGMTGNSGRTITNVELRITNEEAAECGRWQVGSGQCPVDGGSVNSKQCLVDSRSVGQWVSERPAHPFSPAPFLPCSPAPQRRFYNSAKAAHGARHDGERYWRHRGAWLWQPEIRDTKYEIRGRTTGDAPGTMEGGPQGDSCGPTTYHSRPTALSRSTDPLTHCPTDLLDTGHLSPKRQDRS